MNHPKSEKNENSPECKIPKMKNEIWEDKQKRINEKQRLRRQHQKEEGLKTHADEMKEYRKAQNPEYTKIESAKRKALREKRNSQFLKNHLDFNYRKMLNDFFDSNFEENKPSISKNEWEKLKKAEIDHEIKIGGTIKEICKDRDEEIKLLQENPNHPCAGSIIFFIKTGIHRPKDHRELTKEEINWLKSLVFGEKEIEPKKYNYYESKKDYYKEKQKASYETKKLCRKTDNLNLRFIKADPNKVLSIDEITNNPFVSNFPQREQHKIDLWKADENLEYLDLWSKQREAYELEVENLSIEYKENFLKINGGSNFSGNF